MPKADRKKYYAVRLGREGPNIYTTWSQCNANVSRFPGAIYKSFTSQLDAEEWLKAYTSRVSVNHESHIEIAQESTPTQSFAFGSSQMLKSPSLSTQREQATRRTLSDIQNAEPPSQNPSEGIDNVAAFATPSPAEIILSEEQRKVLDMVKQGRNVFFTGSAGTGKSVLLREIIRTLSGGSQPSLAITASTGIASVNIGGVTLHSWAGIGLGNEEAKKLAGKILGQPTFDKVRERWRRVRTLVIDEISMIDGILFDKLEYIARVLRRDERPFGGIQLVLSGDFCQLPPVPDRQNMQATFAFDSHCWRQCVPNPVTLTKVFRQKDQTFVDMLNAMRFGRLDEQTITAFKQLSRPVVYEDGFEPTQLFPTRREVDNANEQRLRQLPDPLVRYPATDVRGVDSNGAKVSHARMENLLERLVVPRVVCLKVGAQVMLIKNMVQGHLVNGSVGQVIAFSTAKQAIQEHTEIGIEESAKEGKSKLANLSDQGEDNIWPVVQFPNGRKLLCVPAEFSIENADGGMEARRRQIPLILAWALSIHKSQGQTLERVKVDLGRTFEKGQAYVALSRATSMKTLQILNFDPMKVMAHPRVLEWQEELEHDEIQQNALNDEMDIEEAIESFWS